MADKQLVIVIEGTSAMGPHWKNILSDYLEKIIRAFCAKDATRDTTGEKSSASTASESTFELALVVFNTRGPYSDFLVRRSGWTRDVDNFLSWLSAMSFSGGGWEDVATAEGLSEALTMFAIPQNGYESQENLDGKRHCILVSTSNPYPLATPVYKPKIDSDDNGEAQTTNSLYDAETVASWFGQCSVSLSVVCPRNLLKLRAIYNVANSNQITPEPAIVLRQPYHLVLLSDSFTEACAALSQSNVLSENASTLNKSLISTENSPQSDINKELSTEKSMESVPAEPCQPSMPQHGFPGTPNSQTSSSPVSQDIITKNESVSETNVTVSMPKSLQNITNGVQSSHGVPQQAQEMKSVGVSGATSNLPTTQQGSTPLSSPHHKYVKVWEGDLCVMRPEEAVVITKMEGFRNMTVSETIAADWPTAMQVDRLIPADHMNNPQYAGKGEFLVFRALNQHAFLTQLQEKSYCAVVPLPSHTLLISTSDRENRLIGMLFPKDIVIMKPQASEQESLDEVPIQLAQQHSPLQQQQNQHLQQQQPQPQPQQTGDGGTSQGTSPSSGGSGFQVGLVTD